MLKPLASAPLPCRSAVMLLAARDIHCRPIVLYVQRRSDCALTVGFVRLLIQSVSRGAVIRYPAGREIRRIENLPKRKH